MLIKRQVIVVILFLLKFWKSDGRTEQPLFLSCWKLTDAFVIWETAQHGSIGGKELFCAYSVGRAVMWNELMKEKWRNTTFRPFAWVLNLQQATNPFPSTKILNYQRVMLLYTKQVIPQSVWRNPQGSGDMIRVLVS